MIKLKLVRRIPLRILIFKVKLQFLSLLVVMLKRLPLMKTVLLLLRRLKIYSEMVKLSQTLTNPSPPECRIVLLDNISSSSELRVLVSKMPLIKLLKVLLLVSLDKKLLNHSMLMLSMIFWVLLLVRCLVLNKMVSQLLPSLTRQIMSMRNMYWMHPKLSLLILLKISLLNINLRAYLVCIFLLSLPLMKLMKSLP